MEGAEERTRQKGGDPDRQALPDVLEEVAAHRELLGEPDRREQEEDRGDLHERFGARREPGRQPATRSQPAIASMPKTAAIMPTPSRKPPAARRPRNGETAMPLHGRRSHRRRKRRVIAKSASA